METKDDLLNKLRAYADTPDDDVVRFKQKIKDALLRCPELLYALHNEELESELFDEDGNINAEVTEDGEFIPLGEWDRYFGANSNIRDFLFIPEVQHMNKNFLCYTIGFREEARFNKVDYILQVTFTILCSPNPEYVYDTNTGLSRHDLIGSIIRERFNWSNIFGLQCSIAGNRELVTDTNFITRTIVFELTKPKEIVNTPLNGKTTVINYQFKR